MEGDKRSKEEKKEELSQYRVNLRQLITEAIASHPDVQLQALRTALSLKYFEPIYLPDQKTSPTFFDGVDLAVFVLSVAHKAQDLTARYFVLLHTCKLLMKDAAYKELTGEVSPIFGLY